MYRIGHGYDLHRLEPPPPRGAGRAMVLGGVRLEHDTGPVGHSDGDAVLHALTDAILGALGEPDIGQLFPDTDPRHDGADSSAFLEEALRRMEAAGYQVGNLDLTVICERPRLAPHKDAIARRLAELCRCERGRVNLKGLERP
jgi:2-C-methyl-D-erythritol 2,4-cyclodiphosphate synthase